MDLPHFVSPCAGVLDGSQIGNLMELCDTTAPSIFFCKLGVGGQHAPRRVQCAGDTLQQQHTARRLAIPSRGGQCQFSNPNGPTEVHPSAARSGLARSAALQLAKGSPARRGLASPPPPAGKDGYTECAEGATVPATASSDGRGLSRRGAAVGSPFTNLDNRSG